MKILYLRVRNPTENDRQLAKRIITTWNRHTGFLLPKNMKMFHIDSDTKIVSVPLRHWVRKFKSAFPNW